VDLDLPGPDRTDDTEAQRELAALVPRCIEYLPEPYREALRATTFENVSHRELARRWGISVSGAKSRVQRGRRRLADLYRQCCHLEFDARGKVIAYSPRDPCGRDDEGCETMPEAHQHGCSGSA
jgi:RNA polymerase sigma-70 factor (ECF subfamily)